MRPTHRTVETVYIGSSLRPQGERLVEEGVRVARAAGARVHLVHAFTPEPLSLRWEPTGLDAPSFHALCGARLAALREQAHRLGIGVGELAGLTAEPGRAADLLAEKASGPGSLLVVGAAERAGPLARVLGSTANAVVRRAS